MPLILFVAIIGIAAGLIAVRVMNVKTDFITAAAFGIAGAMLGWFALRFLLGLSGWLVVVAGSTVVAVLGAIALIWFWKNLK
ncbi:MAG: GlsB/YeaQ/YmgE family stress response membrane protein [Paracoccaceae bacterium]